jgi:hypothetical protein
MMKQIGHILVLVLVIDSMYVSHTCTTCGVRDVWATLHLSRSNLVLQK